jgi:hypothetical protein
MRRKGAALRVWLVTIACAAALSACRDVGLPDRNLPLEEAQNRELSYQVYEPSASRPALAMGGRHWIRSLPVEAVPSHLLVPIGTAGGTTLYALRGAEAPYSRLYSPVAGGRWAPYLRLN